MDDALLRGLLVLQAGKVADEDSAPMDFQEAFILESAEVPGDQFTHGAKFGGQILMALRQLDVYSVLRGRARLRKPENQRNQPLAHGRKR